MEESALCIYINVYYAWVWGGREPSFVCPTSSGHWLIKRVSANGERPQEAQPAPSAFRH